MRRWLTVPLAVLAALLLAVAGFALFVSTDNGTKVDAVLHVGTHKDGAKAGKMYVRCTNLSGDGAAVDTSDACTLTVHKRDRVTITLVNDDTGVAHDLRLDGTPYALFPAGFHVEAPGGGSDSATFVAWATGDFALVCEMPGHEAAGMAATLRVLE